jgi:hypothetical protein
MRALLFALALPACGVAPAVPPPEPLPLPFTVSDYYSPDGFFGDGETRGQLDLVKSCTDRAPGAQGDCYTITYHPGVKRFAGIFWQHPHNNWGDRPGHRVAAGASRITLQARGPAGQLVSVGAGQKDSQPLHDDFQLEEVSVSLTGAWARQEIPFRGMTYAGGVIGAFLVSIKAGDSDEPVTFQLDDIRWVP